MDILALGGEQKIPRAWGGKRNDKKAFLKSRSNAQTGSPGSIPEMAHSKSSQQATEIVGFPASSVFGFKQLKEDKGFSTELMIRNA